MTNYEIDKLKLTKEKVAAMEEDSSWLTIHRYWIAHDLLLLHAEVARLAAIVAKCPKTADGIPVVPGYDTIWKVDRQGRCRTPIQRIFGGDVQPQFLNDDGSTNGLRWDEVYSTEQKAIEADQELKQRLAEDAEWEAASEAALDNIAQNP